MNSAATPTQTFTILRSHFTRIDPDDFMIVLSPEDLSAINAIPQLAASRSRSHLSINSSGAIDYNGNSIIAVDAENGIRALDYTNDMTSPNFLGFSLDLDSNTLSLTFDEAIKATLLNFPAITIQGSRKGGVQYSLTGGMPPQADSTTLNATLSLEDLALLKVQNSLDNRYLRCSGLTCC